MGDPVVSMVIPGRSYRVTNSRPVRGGTRPRAGAKGECNRGTAKRRKTKCGGMGGRGRSALIVPTKPGNSARGDPGDGKRGVR